MSTDILNSPVRVNVRAECIYFHAPGEVCVDLTSGKPEDRARVLALVGQAQRMAQVLMQEFGDHARELGRPCGCDACAVLRDAGVMSGQAVESEGR